MIDKELRTQIIEDRLTKKRTVAQLTAEYGVSAASISRWTVEYLRKHDAHDLSDLATSTDQKLLKLREENEKLRAENEGLRIQYDTLQKLLMDIYNMNSSHVNLQSLPDATI